MKGTLHKTEQGWVVKHLKQGPMLFEKGMPTQSTFETVKIQINPYLEKYYLLDLAGLTVWKDGKLDNEESYFLFKVAETLKLSDAITQESIDSISQFIEKYKSEIQYFNYSNPVKHFYDQTNKTVSKLVGRNKKRLIKEISQSKELMVLLTQSTTRELNENEKKKVKKQLLDICKTIPSLTIFLLPGGGILLPVLIKYIPQLLPSAFNENLEDE